MSTPESENQQESEFPALTWHVFRARENPRKAVMAAAIILAVLAIIIVSYGNPLMVLMAILIFAVTLNGFFLPTTYTLDRSGITTDKRILRYTRRWSEFRSYVRTTGGVVVSPFRDWTFLDNFRGLHLLLPEDPNRVLEYLAARLPEKKRRRAGAGEAPQNPGREVHDDKELTE